MPQNRITEKINVKIDSCEPKNPIYLIWKMAEGGYGYWLFGINQIVGLSTRSSGIFKKAELDISLIDTSGDWTDTTVTPEMTLRAERLDSGDIKLLQTLISSNKVYMLINPLTWQSDGAKWRVVRIDRGSYKINQTKHTLHVIEVKIKLIDYLVP